MGKFFAELKRRHIYRVGAAYAVVAWVLLQLANNIAPGLNWPSWALSLVIVLLGLGFPIVLVFAWALDLKVAPGGEPTQIKTGALDWVLIGSLTILIVFALFQELIPPRGPTTAEPSATALEAQRQAANNQLGVISIAVLPFANMSGDASQEFFSDGTTEEITAALAKVPDLRVVARTSAFQFKAQNRDIQSIGQQLHATHFIEGSVRKAGDRVRVTAQLIKADDGTHIWAQDYDRQLTDIFAIQEDIARAIAASLRMPLGLKPGENLVNNRSIDPESYQLYIRAKALRDARGLVNLLDAARIFEQVVARNPDYAPAWTFLGGTYHLIGQAYVNSTTPIDEVRSTVSELLRKDETASQRAIALDPNFSTGYAGSGVVFWARGKPIVSEDMYLKGIALDANDATTLNGYAIRLAFAGRLREALTTELKALDLEPLDPTHASASAYFLWLNGRNSDAIALAKTLRPTDRAPALARIYASMGRYGEAADALMEIAASDQNSDLLREATRLLRIASEKAAPPQTLSRFPPALDFVYLSVGAPSGMLDYLERNADVGFIGGTLLALVWHPSYAELRKTERFKNVMRKAGLVDYWRAKGWPDLCQPTTADDFVCE